MDPARAIAWAAAPLLTGRAVAPLSLLLTPLSRAESAAGMLRAVQARRLGARRVRGVVAAGRFYPIAPEGAA